MTKGGCWEAKGLFYLKYSFKTRGDACHWSMSYPFFPSFYDHLARLLLMYNKCLGLGACLLGMHAMLVAAVLFCFVHFISIFLGTCE